MENTLSNKEKFFAQYLGANTKYVGAGKTFRGTKKNEILTLDNIKLMAFSNHRVLELTNLKNITDEDAIELAIRTNVKIKGINELDVIGGYNSLIEFKESLIVNLKRDKIPTSATDIIRSKGYALPFMGLSVEKQIEYGWVKLNKPL